MWTSCATRTPHMFYSCLRCPVLPHLPEWILRRWPYVSVSCVVDGSDIGSNDATAFFCLCNMSALPPCSLSLSLFHLPPPPCVVHSAVCWEYCKPGYVDEGALCRKDGSIITCASGHKVWKCPPPPCSPPPSSLLFAVFVSLCVCPLPFPPIRRQEVLRPRCWHPAAVC